MSEANEKEKWIEEILETFDNDWESFRKNEAFDHVSSKFLSVLETGNEFYRAKEYKAAFTHYEEAVKIFEGKIPVNERFWFKMGLVYRILGKSMLKEPSADYKQPLGYQKAIACFQKAVELNPAFKEGWIVLAFSYDKLSNFYHQRTLLKNQLAPSKIDNYFQNLIACLKNELAGLERVIQLDPNEKKIEFWRRTIKHRLGLFKELWGSEKNLDEN